VTLIGLLADLLSCNRKLLEELIYRVRKMEISGDPHLKSGGGTNA
jgi:hypothetical protein